MKAFDYLAAFYGHEHETDKFVAAVDSLLNAEDATVRAIPFGCDQTSIDWLDGRRSFTRTYRRRTRTSRRCRMSLPSAWMTAIFAFSRSFLHLGRHCLASAFTAVMNNVTTPGWLMKKFIAASSQPDGCSAGLDKIQSTARCFCSKRRMNRSGGSIIICIALNTQQESGTGGEESGSARADNRPPAIRSANVVRKSRLVFRPLPRLGPEGPQSLAFRAVAALPAWPDGRA